MTPYFDEKKNSKRGGRPRSVPEPPARDVDLGAYWGQVRDLGVFAGSAILLMGICSSSSRRNDKVVANEPHDQCPSEATGDVISSSGSGLGYIPCFGRYGGWYQ